MYEIIKNVIEKQDFDLRDILYKIAKMYIEGYITEEQKEELEEMARNNAKSENSYEEASKQVEKIFEELKVINKRLDKLEGKEEIPEEEYPEYVQPTGAHDSYKLGDKITFEGKKYECIYENCVWSPEEYPQGWKLIEETIEDEEESV